MAVSREFYDFSGMETYFTVERGSSPNQSAQWCELNFFLHMAKQCLIIFGRKCLRYYILHLCTFSLVSFILILSPHVNQYELYSFFIAISHLSTLAVPYFTSTCSLLPSYDC